MSCKRSHRGCQYMDMAEHKLGLLIPLGVKLNRYITSGQCQKLKYKY